MESLQMTHYATLRKGQGPPDDDTRVRKIGGAPCRPMATLSATVHDWEQIHAMLWSF
jgi:hypothetical protein